MHETQPGANEELTRGGLFAKIAEHPLLVRAALGVGALTGGAMTAVAVSGETGDNGVATAAQTPPNLNYFANIGSAQITVNQLTQKRLVIGFDEHIKGYKAAERSPGCFWTHGGFTNSMKVNGRVVPYYDPVSAELCPDKYSPFGYVKVRGGTTGRDCGNAATPNRVPNELPISSVINLKDRNSLNTSFRIVAKLAAGVAAECGYVQVNDLVSQRFNFKNFVEANGQFNERLFLRIYDSIQQKFSAKIVCKPEKTTTTVTRTGTGTTETRPGTTTTVTQPGTTSTETTTTSTTTTTTTIAPQPPYIRVQQKTPGFEGVNEGDRIEICAVASSNPSSDSFNVAWSTRYPQDTVSADFKDNGEDCTWFQAGNTYETDENVTATATDSVNGLQSSDSTGQFPVRQPQ